MKRIIRRYIVRDPSDIVDRVRKYETLKFNPLVNAQTHFENLVGIDLGDINKTELYINGQRFHTDDYEIVEGNILKLISTIELSVDDVLVFVWRN